MLRRQSAIPLYEKIKTEILSDINSSKYKVGQKIPTEKQLSDTYEASRITIRKAVEQLVSENVLIKKQGKGTFVRGYKVKRNLLDLISYTDYMNRIGKIPNAVIEDLKVEKADDNLAKILQISQGSKILKLSRTMDIEENNPGYELSYYDLGKFPSLQNQISNGVSTMEILNNEYHSFANSSRQTLDVIFASQAIAKYLRVEIGSPVYQLKRVAYDNGGDTIYYAIMYYDVNKISFSINVNC